MSKKTLAGTEQTISLVLKIGVTASSLIILLGLLLFFIRPGQGAAPLGQASYSHYTTASYTFPHSLPALASSIARGQGAGFLMLGVLLLVLTPMIRVASSILLFARQRDIPMAVVTFCVLAILIGSFYLGIAVQ